MNFYVYLVSRLALKIYVERLQEVLIVMFIFPNHDLLAPIGPLNGGLSPQMKKIRQQKGVFFPDWLFYQQVYKNKMSYKPEFEKLASQTDPSSRWDILKLAFRTFLAR